MTNEVILSIIIPIYNVENYVEECLNSIKNQLLDCVECILVDDGSTDNSGSLCDKYQKDDARFKVIHKENGGLASARNAGLTIASGKYIAFLDGDDRVAQNCIKEIVAWANTSDADMCFMQAVKFYPNGQFKDLGDKIYKKDISNKSKEEIYVFLRKRPKYPGSACTKIYRKEFLKKYDLNFPRDKRKSEDLGFVRDCIINAIKLEALDIPFYEYRQNRAGSITNKRTQKNFFDLHLFIEETINIINKKDKEKQLPEIKCMLSFAAYEYSILLWMFSKIKFDDEKFAGSILKKYRYLLKYGKTKKIKLIRLVTAFLGLKNTSRLMDIIKR